MNSITVKIWILDRKGLQDNLKMPPRLLQGIQDRFWLNFGRSWDDFWFIFDSFLIDCWLMYEWWMTNDECRMINDECWMMTAVTSKKTRLNRSPNSKLGAVTSKKARLNRFPSKQWTRCCYIKRGKTKPPFPNRTVNSVLLYRKRQAWSVSHSNSKLGAVTLKKAKLNRFPSKQ